MTYNIVILDTVEINTFEDLYLFLNRREDNKKMEDVPTCLGKTNTESNVMANTREDLR